MLKPNVGVILAMSSSDKDFSIVVFPALSKPRTRILASFSLFLILRIRVNNPYKKERKEIYILK